MQDFNVLRPEGYLSDDRQTINDNFESIITDFSGTVFPTNNLFAGMKCNRIDQKRVYRLESNLFTWKLLYDYGGTEITAPKANKAVLDGDGNTISTTYLKSVPVFVGASSNANGEEGLVPAPNINASEYFLKGDGTWSPTPQLTKANLLEMIYPVGSIYMSVNPTNPGSLFGGTWEKMPAGRVLIPEGESDWGTEYEAGSTGGEATHTLTVDEMPSHNHSGTASTTNINGSFYIRGNGIAATGCFKSENYSVGARQDVTGQKITLNANVLPSLTVANKGGGMAHNNMQPYISVYIWKRIS